MCDIESSSSAMMGCCRADWRKGRFFVFLGRTTLVVLVKCARARLAWNYRDPGRVFVFGDVVGAKQMTQNIAGVQDPASRSWFG
jgi:hypothetical protein